MEGNTIYMNRNLLTVTYKLMSVKNDEFFPEIKRQAFSSVIKKRPRHGKWF